MSLNEMMAWKLYNSQFYELLDNYRPIFELEKRNELIATTIELVSLNVLKKDPILYNFPNAIICTYIVHKICMKVLVPIVKKCKSRYFDQPSKKRIHTTVRWLKFKCWMYIWIRSFIVTFMQKVGLCNQKKKIGYGLSWFWIGFQWVQLCCLLLTIYDQDWPSMMTDPTKWPTDWVAHPYIVFGSLIDSILVGVSAIITIIIICGLIKTLTTEAHVVRFEIKIFADINSNSVLEFSN